MTNARTSSRTPDVTLRRRLEAIRTDNPGTLRAAVAAEALDYHDDPAAFFRDLQGYGCASGLVSGLIYYADTHAFFEAHYDEIEDLRADVESSMGEPLRIRGDLKNFFAWFAFEETAYRMAVDDLELEP